MLNHIERVRRVAELMVLFLHPEHAIDGRKLAGFKTRQWVSFEGNQWKIAPDGQKELKAVGVEGYPDYKRYCQMEGLYAFNDVTYDTKLKALTAELTLYVPPKTTIKAKPDAKKQRLADVAELITSPGWVTLTPQLLNHPDMDAYNIGLLAWCNAQSPAPTLKQLATWLDTDESFVRQIVKDIRGMGFEVKVQDV